MSAHVPENIWVGRSRAEVLAPRSSAASDVLSPEAAPKMVRIGTMEPPRVALFKQWLNPAVALATLAMCLLQNMQPVTPAIVALAIACALLTSQIVRAPDVDRWNTADSHIGLALLRTAFEWSCVAIMLTLMIGAFNAGELLSRQLMTTWYITGGATLLLAHWSSPRLARWIDANRVRAQRHIIIGMNDMGVELAQRMKRSACAGEFCGYFDFRGAERLPASTRHLLKGNCREAVEYVRSNAITAVYISLPISTTPRIEELLADLRDTTASIYFVPDIFAFDTLQPRFVEINGMPALSVCDTPLQGMSGVRKRLSDLALSVVALAVAWPVMLAIALAVRLSSPGPILFKQKRYGLNGEEILVYKFRSMSVCEDGAIVTQAQRHDKRLTPVGGFLRRTSLDELPQIINVLQGTMSFVGPRPHAVAHNEQYRKLINGYMIRHKVRPGITGWAQVNGFRGETATIDKMRQRVRYDLDYLQRWSLWLDLRILFKTVVMVIRKDNAY